MSRISILFICVTLIIGIHGDSIQSDLSSMEKDATELAELYGKYSRSVPAVWKTSVDVRYCGIIDRCCPDPYRSRAISLFGKSFQGAWARNQFGDYIDRCINKTIIRKKDLSCVPYLSTNMVDDLSVENADLNKFEDAFIKHLIQDELLDGVFRNCNGKEMHAFMCLSNQKRWKSCSMKIVKALSNHTDYREQINQMKTSLIQSEREFSKAFKEN